MPLALINVKSLWQNLVFLQLHVIFGQVEDNITVLFLTLCLDWCLEWDNLSASPLLLLLLAISLLTFSHSRLVNIILQSDIQGYTDDQAKNRQQAHTNRQVYYAKMESVMHTSFDTNQKKGDPHWKWTDVWWNKRGLFPTVAVSLHFLFSCPFHGFNGALSHSLPMNSIVSSFWEREHRVGCPLQNIKMSKKLVKKKKKLL